MPKLKVLTVKSWFVRNIAGIFLISIISSCGLLPDKSERNYLKSKTIAVITVPEGLQQPVNRNPVVIPVVADDYIPPEDLIIPPALSEQDVKIAIVESSAHKISQGDSHGQGADFTPLAAELVTDSDFEYSLLVEETFDVVWERVEKALLNLGFVVEDKNKLTQYYSIYRQILKIDFDEGDVSKQKELELEKSPDKEYYKIKLTEAKATKSTQTNTRIEVLDRTGDSLGSDLDKHLLLQIKAQFNTPPDKEDEDQNQNQEQVEAPAAEDHEHTH